MGAQAGAGSPRRKTGSLVQKLTEAAGGEDPGLWDLKLEIWDWGGGLYESDFRK